MGEIQPYGRKDHTILPTSIVPGMFSLGLDWIIVDAVLSDIFELLGMNSNRFPWIVTICLLVPTGIAVCSMGLLTCWLESQRATMSRPCLYPKCSMRERVRHVKEQL